MEETWSIVNPDRLASSSGVAGSKCHRLEQHFIICIAFGLTSVFDCFNRFRDLYEALHERAEFIDDVAGALHQFGALPDQAVTTTRQRIMYRAGYRKYFPSLFSSQPGRNQRTAALGGLDDE